MPFGLDDRLKRGVDHLRSFSLEVVLQGRKNSFVVTATVCSLALIAILQSTCSMAASADSAPVSPSAQATQTGGSYTTTFSSSSGFSGTFLFDVELWTTAGTRVFQSWETHTLTGQATVTVTKAIPADVSGSLIAKAGIFSTDWSTRYLWSDNTGAFLGRRRLRLWSLRRPRAGN